MNKFNCIKCGNCCKFDSDDESTYPKFLPESNIISLTSPRLLIQDWEKDSFPENTIVPGYVFLDIKNNTIIIFNYNLKDASCPNLHNNECKNYSNRPISCRLYPCSFRDISTSSLIQSAYGNCPAEIPSNKLKELLDSNNSSKEALRKKLFERYGNGFAYGVISNIILETQLKFLADLEKKNIIKLAKSGYPLEFLKKRLAQSNSIEISELFYKHQGHYLHEAMLSKEGFERIIKKISL